MYNARQWFTEGYVQVLLCMILKTKFLKNKKKEEEKFKILRSN